MSELDNPVWWALAGPQRHLGTVSRLAARFDPDVSPFGALADDPTDAHWEDLATITGPGGQAALIVGADTVMEPGQGWRVTWELSGLQMIGVGAMPGRAARSRFGPAASNGDGEAPEPLGADDVDDMLALVADARPGPFLRRTVEFGGYVGIRRRGRLIAMAGERLRPPGYGEISAVATDPGLRRQGLARLVVGAVVAAIVGRGEVPFLNVAASNSNAIELYASMGFTESRRLTFVVAQAPGAPTG